MVAYWGSLRIRWSYTLTHKVSWDHDTSTIITCIVPSEHIVTEFVIIIKPATSIIPCILLEGRESSLIHSHRESYHLQTAYRWSLLSARLYEIILYMCCLTASLESFKSRIRNSSNSLAEATASCSVGILAPGQL